MAAIRDGRVQMLLCVIVVVALLGVGSWWLKSGPGPSVAQAQEDPAPQPATMSAGWQTMSAADFVDATEELLQVSPGLEGSS